MRQYDPFYYQIVNVIQALEKGSNFCLKDGHLRLPSINTWTTIRTKAREKFFIFINPSCTFSPQEMLDVRKIRARKGLLTI